MWLLRLPSLAQKENVKKIDESLNIDTSVSTGSIRLKAYVTIQPGRGDPDNSSDIFISACLDDTHIARELQWMKEEQFIVVYIINGEECRHEVKFRYSEHSRSVLSYHAPPDICVREADSVMVYVVLMASPSQPIGYQERDEKLGTLKEQGYIEEPLGYAY